MKEPGFVVDPRCDFIENHEIVSAKVQFSVWTLEIKAVVRPQAAFRIFPFVPSHLSLRRLNTDQKRFVRTIGEPHEGLAELRKEWRTSRRNLSSNPGKVANRLVRG